ncbi:hypothetical protein [Lysinibacillus sp. ZYM-1]|nr:hypothetical protein [Lysinibacillus sp. ZYM-1]
MLTIPKSSIELFLSIKLLDYFRFVYEDSPALGRYKGYDENDICTYQIT